MPSPTDDYAMRLALDQAHNAWLVGEVPVGAVIVRPASVQTPGEAGVQVLATGYNRPITTHDPTAHAEIVALRHAAALLENYRLPGCTLVVTLEPCPMCAMALMHARLARVVFGAPDPKTGAAGSVVNLFAQAQLNHHTEVVGGVMADACGALLRDFFAERRARQRAAREEEEGAASGIGVEGGLAGGVQAGLESSLDAGAVEALIPIPEVVIEGAGDAAAPSEAAAPIPAGEATELPAQAIEPKR